MLTNFFTEDLANLKLNSALTVASLMTALTGHYSTRQFV